MSDNAVIQHVTSLKQCAEAILKTGQPVRAAADGKDIPYQSFLPG